MNTSFTPLSGGRSSGAERAGLRPRRPPPHALARGADTPLTVNLHPPSQLGIVPLEGLSLRAQGSWLTLPVGGVCLLRPPPHALTRGANNPSKVNLNPSSQLGIVPLEG